MNMRKLKVVVIENDEDERFFINQGFQVSGLFEIINMLSSGEDIVNVLKQSEVGLPDLVMTDMNLNGKDGFDILKEIKRTPGLSDIPVIILSTTSTNGMVEKARQLGVYRYKEKPNDFRDYDAFAAELYGELVKEKTTD